MQTAALAAPPVPAYDYDHPRLHPDVMHDLFVGADEIGPGDQLGAFDLPTVGGSRFRSSELAADGRPVLVTFGSRTCPITESAADGLKRLHAEYGHRVRFVMLAVREAHPGASVPQPHTPEAKAAHAAALAAHHALPFEVAVDDVAGTLHRRLGSRPSSAFLLDATGTILFRAQWSNETEAIGEALAAVAAGRPPPHASVTRTVPAMAKAMGFGGPVHEAAGAGALLDTWKIAPPFGVIMAIAGLLTFLPPARRGGPAMVLMGLLGAAATAAGLAALLGR